MSTRSVADKLLIKPTTTLWSSHTSRLQLVEPLPTGVRRVRAPEQARTSLVFADDAASLRDLLATHQERLARPEVLWVAYPKGNRTDVNRDTRWPFSVSTGCGRSPGCRSTRCGRRCASARSRRARHPSPGVGALSGGWLLRRELAPPGP
jgi:hypothetical protein